MKLPDDAVVAWYDYIRTGIEDGRLQGSKRIEPTIFVQAMNAAQKSEWMTGRANSGNCASLADESHCQASGGVPPGSGSEQYSRLMLSFSGAHCCLILSKAAPEFVTII